MTPVHSCPSDSSQTGLLAMTLPSDVKRRKDDMEALREWSNYRQNMTTSIADLSNPGANHLREAAAEAVYKYGRAASPLKERADYLCFGLPRVNPIDLQYATVQRPLHKQLQHKPMHRSKAVSAWDLRNTEMGRRIEGAGHYAESDLVPERNRDGSFFASSRHHSHYFSNADLFSSAGFNYLRYAKASELQLQDTTHPHLLIRNLSFSHDLRSTLDCMLLRLPRYLHTVSDISLELFGGDTLALMYTSELEMRTLLRVLTQESPPPGTVSGKLSINGHRLRLGQLAARIAHVPVEDPCGVLTVEQHLRCSADFRPPATDAFIVEDMIEQMIRSLALTPFKDRLVEGLGKTEKQRLKIAMALLKDTDILIIDNITRDMDIYDVAFLVDFIRDWVLKLGRIAIVAIAPTTIEILTMFHKAAILASGRLVYGGASNEMVDYFETIGFPCPPFKNPCDYYVDLVTCDHLTPEAQSESRERIKNVADAWGRRSAAFQPRSLPVATVSPRIRHASLPGTFLAILRKLWYISINHPFFLLLEPIVALMISLFIGLTFYHLPYNSRSTINDRFGLVECLTFLGTFPLLLTTVSRCHVEREYLHYDLRLGRYGACTYFVARQILDIPVILFTTAAYSLPVGALTGLFFSSHSALGALTTLSCIMLVHLTLWRLVAAGASYAFRSSTVAASFLGLFLLFWTVLSGIPITSIDQTDTVALLSLVSPLHWIGRILVQEEFAPSRGITNVLPVYLRHPINTSEILFGCERKKLLARKITEVPIFTLTECAKLPGSSLLYSQGFDPTFLFTPSSLTAPPQPTIYLKIGLLVIGGWLVVSSLAACAAIKSNHRPKVKGSTLE